MNFYKDRLGNEVGKDYSTSILIDPYFESRLKAFDPSLKVMFDQRIKRWVILEAAPDGTGWNVLMKCQDDKKNPVPLGDWVFQTLWAWRQSYNQRHKNPNAFYDGLIAQADANRAKIEASGSDDHKHLIKEEIREWQKAACEINNEPKSDVTAGFPKVSLDKNKETVCP